MLMAVWAGAALVTAHAASGGEPGLAVSGRVSSDMRTVRVHLQGTPYTGISRQDGTFTIHNVPPGVYTLEVIDSLSVWPQLEVDVGVRQPGRVQALSARKETLVYPLQLEPLGAANYFEKREGFNLRAMLMNPMVLTMGFSFFSIFLMPQLMKNIDPEALKEMQDAQKQLLGGASAAPPAALEGKSAAPKRGAVST